MPRPGPLSTSIHPAVMEDLPPSAKLVAKSLEYEGELTQAELIDSTLLPARTVRSALSVLEEHDLITARISLMDARKRIYSLATGDPSSSVDS